MHQRNKTLDSNLSKDLEIIKIAQNFERKSNRNFNTGKYN